MSFTEEQLKQALPVSLRGNVNQELINSINATLSDPELLEIYKENLLTFSSVLQQGRFKLSSYLNAVRYVSIKLMGSSNLDAYVKTFPDKYQDFLARGVVPKDIASYVTAYNKSKLVNLVYEQALIPTHILNAPLFQRALNTQAELMLNAKSEKVRCDAANSLLSHLKPPETKKIELDLGVREDSTLHVLRESTLALVEQQKELLAAGASARDIAQAPLVIEAEAEVTDAG